MLCYVLRMSKKDQGLTKAEKRWQRQLRAGKSEQGTWAAGLASNAPETPEERALLNQFGKKLGTDESIQGSAEFRNASVKRYGVKLSAALLDVCKPLLEEAGGDPGRVRKAVMLGIIGWNMACSEGAVIDDLLANLAASTGSGPAAKELSRMLRATVEDMKARKLKLYPEIKLLIMEHEVVFQGTSLQVNVAGAEPIAEEKPQPTGLLNRVRNLIR